MADIDLPDRWLGARDARAEAAAALPDGMAARVLEPSPPAVDDGQWFADDPVSIDVERGTVASPVPGIDHPQGCDVRAWADVASEDPSLAAFACDRWLGPHASLEPLPAGFHTTRDALARVALHALYRPRRAANGKYGLRWTLGGFGTPFFGDDEQVRVVGDAIVRQHGPSALATPITTLRAAATACGIEFDPDFDHGFEDVAPAGDPDAPLGVDRASALALGEWFGFAASALETLRARHAGRAPSRVQLWPEHFDLAFDIAYADPDDRSRRVNLGASPGDAGHPDPYLYVGPWTSERPGDDDYWNRPFGAVLPYTDLLAAGDADAQRTAALDFYERGLTLLTP